MILSCGKSMITDVFGTFLFYPVLNTHTHTHIKYTTGTLSPEIVTASFATAFVSGLSAANLGGRMGWVP